MPRIVAASHHWLAISSMLAISVLACGCSRLQHRLQADAEAYGLIAERSGDPRWAAPRYGIDPDPRSRFYDPYDPDHPPMPLDDPASHQYLHCVDHKRGWSHWHDNGDRFDLENPGWREALNNYADIGDDGTIQLDVDASIHLAYLHSSLHQQQLETLYLSALDVTAERFRLDTQFFGGYDARYAHNGSLIPPQLSYSSLLNRFVITPAIDGPGVENNRLTVGRPFGAVPAAEVSRQFATAGELLVGFANSFVFEFTGGDANLAMSLANFSFIQPLLRGAGKDVALEELTQQERNLLANMRSYSQFRQGFYTQVAIGELGVSGPQRGGGGTALQSFSGLGGVGGYLGLLEQQQGIRNSEDNLSLQLRTLARLEALYDNELIDLVQVDQFRQSVENQRVDLISRNNALELALDNFKTDTLGLPSSLPIELDESLISQFQLFPTEASPILESLLELQARVGDLAEVADLLEETALLQEEVESLPDAEDVDDVERVLDDLLTLFDAVQRRLPDWESDLRQAEASLESANDDSATTSDARLTEKERELVARVKNRLADESVAVEKRFREVRRRLKSLARSLSDDTRDVIVRDNMESFRELLELTHGFLLVQASARQLDAEPAGVLREAFEYVEPVRELFEIAREDLAEMESIAPDREKTMDDSEKIRFRRSRLQLQEGLVSLEQGEDQSFSESIATLDELRDKLDVNSRAKTLTGLSAWVQTYLQIVERLSLIPAQARVELIAVEPVELEAPEAFRIALANRLDFMNGRAALVDQWRLIQVNADSLQSVLNVTASGDLRTARNNAVSFRAPTGNLRMGLEFDAPFTRLLERNAYRESQINYQRSRRSFIRSRDALERGLRALLRNLEQFRQRLEIQRRAVTIAMRRVDQTQLSLNTPPGQLQPGARPTISPTTAINLLGAQNALQGTQNQLLTAWLSHYAARIRLYRELGIMQVAPDGRWVEQPIEGSSALKSTSSEYKADPPNLEELPAPLEFAIDADESP